MKYISTVVILILFCVANLSSQIQHEVEGDAVIDGKLGVKKTIVDPSAAVEIQSTTEGILIPRMTSTQRSAIVNPAQGLLVFDNTTNTFWFNDGTVWTELAGGGLPGSAHWSANGNHIYNNNSGNVGIGINTPLEKFHIANNGNFRLDGTVDSVYTEFNTFGTTAAVLNIDPIPINNTSASTIRLFRTTDASAANFIIFKGDGSLDTNHLLGGNGDSYLSLNENLGVGTNTPNEKVEVTGNMLIRSPSANGALILSPSNLGYQVHAEFVIQSLETVGGSNTAFSMGRNSLFQTSDDTNRYIADASTPAQRILFGTNGSIHFQSAPDGVGGDLATFSNLLSIRENGDVGIGTIDPQGYKLAVRGNMGAEEIEVRTNFWADFVFDKDYNLKSLKQVESFIETNGHLPDVPSEKIALEQPLNLGNMDVLLLQKIEELTLYTIQQEKLIEAQNDALLKLEKRINQLEKNK